MAVCQVLLLTNKRQLSAVGPGTEFWSTTATWRRYAGDARKGKSVESKIPQEFNELRKGQYVYSLRMH